MNKKHILLFIIICFITIILIGCNNKPYSGYIKEINNDLYPGDTDHLEFIEENKANIESFKWTSSDNSIIYVNDSGLLRAVNAGNATITYTATTKKNEYSFNLELVVKEIPVNLEKIVIIGANAVSINNNDVKYELIGNTDLELDNTNFYWATSNEEIASFSNDGIIIPHKEGDINLTVTCKDDGKIFANKFIHIYSSGDTYTTGGAEYIVNNIKDYNSLPYGVTHTTYLAQTKTLTTGIDADGFGGVTEAISPDKYYGQQVNILTIPSSSDIKVTTWANMNNSKWTLTSVRNLIADYEKHHPGWRVIAAVNGDFFDINHESNYPYTTCGVMISDGEHYKTSGDWMNNDSANSFMLGFTNDGQIDSIVGNEEVVREDKITLSIYNHEGKIIKEFKIDNINASPNANQTSLYYGLYSKGESSEHKIHQYIPAQCLVLGNGYLVSDAQYALPYSNEDFYGKGTITNILNKDENITLKAGEFFIDSLNEELNSYLSKGVMIRLQYNFCGNYQNIKDALGCRVSILDNGEFNELLTDQVKPSARAPRTCIGRNEKGEIIMMVIDGRQGANNMYGADYTEMAAIMKAYGCLEAYNLDGGGSSTMIIRQGDELICTNSPSDGNERSDSNCVLVVVKEAIVSFTNDVSDSLNGNVRVNIKFDDYGALTNKKWFLECNGILNYLDLKNNEAVINITGLVHNTKYDYYLCYEDDNHNYVHTTLSGSFTTLKIIPKFIAIEIEELEDAFNFKLYYYDPDKSSNIDSARIIIDDDDSFYLAFRDGVASISKDVVTEINNITLKYSYVSINNDYIKVNQDALFYYK